jgi:hypothetical protein
MNGSVIGINAIFVLNYAFSGYGVYAWSWAVISQGRGKSPLWEAFAAVRGLLCKSEEGNGLTETICLCLSMNGSVIGINAIFERPK